MDSPSAERRTFLEIHSADASGPRLLQLEPYTRLANVYDMLGDGVLLWAGRPLTPRDTPARLNMPSGIDSPVDLHFEPAVGHTGPPRAGSFDPQRQPIPAAMPAHFTHRGGGSVGGDGLMSPSLPHGARRGLFDRTPPPAPVGAHPRFEPQPRPLPASAAGHRYASQTPLHTAAAPTPASLLVEQSRRLRVTVAPGPCSRHRYDKFAEAARPAPPPPQSLVDGWAPEPTPVPLEDEIRQLRRELQQMRRQDHSPAAGNHRFDGLVTSPPPKAATARYGVPTALQPYLADFLPQTGSIEELAMEIHHGQMRRLLELRAINAQTHASSRSR